MKHNISIGQSKGVYAIKDNKGVVLYIGYTMNCFTARWKEHVRNAYKYPKLPQDSSFTLYERLNKEVKAGRHFFFNILMTVEEIESFIGRKAERKDVEKWESFFIARLTPPCNIKDNTHFKSSFSEVAVKDYLGKKNYYLDYHFFKTQFDPKVKPDYITQLRPSRRVENILKNQKGAW